jgi:hypothetical protein
MTGLDGFDAFYDARRNRLKEKIREVLNAGNRLEPAAESGVA